MKIYLTVCMLFLLSQVNAQKHLFIKYSQPVDPTVLSEEKKYGEQLYMVDFRDKSGKVVKTVYRDFERSEKPSRKIEQYTTYYFYNKDLLSSEITVGIAPRSLRKTEYVYNTDNKLTQANSFIYLKPVTDDIISQNLSADFYLNNPNQIPTANWNKSNAKIISYNSKGNIINKRFLAASGKSKEFNPARENNFIYNNQDQLVQRSLLYDNGTTWLETYEYGVDGKLIRRHVYENQRFFSVDDYVYTDSTITIVSNAFFPLEPEKQHLKDPYNPNNRSTTVYILDRKSGKYYTTQYGGLKQELQVSTDLNYD